MKILIINWRDIRNPEAGGAEIYFHEIFKRLAAKGHECTVLAHGFKGGETETVIDGMRVVRIGNKFLFNYSVISFLLKNQKEYDLVIEDINKIPFFTPLYVKRPRIHMVMHFFGKTIFKEAFFPLALYVLLMEKLIPFVYKNEQFVAISNSTADEIRSFGVPTEKIKIVEPGIDTSFYNKVGLKADPPVISYVGRLMKYKNVQFVIRALAQLRKNVPGLILEVGGSGDYIDELKRISVESGVGENVKFLGQITNEQKRELLSRSALFVNPSAKEGWGINNIEANLCETVSLSSDVPGLRDSVQNNVTGLLYNPDNTEDFCNKAVRLLTDNNLRTEMERAALARAKTFDWNSIAELMGKSIKEFMA
jgi:glycosyltransferase involved in cell wall biosynthesis